MMKKIDYDLVDIHSHILYGVDDGPIEKETSAEMLHTAMKEGIRTIVVTSHYHPAKCTMEYEELKKHFQELADLAAQVSPKMKLVLGREVYYTSDFIEDLESEKRFTMGDSRHIMVEFDPFTEYSYIYSAINNVIQMGYTPIIAHIERYQCIVNEWKRVYDLTDMGAVIQVNASSVIGGAGPQIKKFVKKLMKNQLVDLIGTDAHSNGRRAPRMLECAEYINKKFGYEYAKQILKDNAEQIIMGTYLEE